MKKLSTGILTICLITWITMSAQAKNTREAIATIVPIAPCIESIDMGGSLDVSWDWTAGGTQTKFGGDAVYKVSGSYTYINTELLEVVVDFDEITLEIEIEQLDPDFLLADYVGLLAYECSPDQTATDGTCVGKISDLEEALKIVVRSEYGLVEDEVVEIEQGYVLLGVWVKAMNPSVEVVVDGKKIKRQNYPLVNVCVEVE